MPSHVGRVTESSLAVQTRPFGHRDLKAEPVGARRAIAAPVEPGMVGQDLQAGPHDEQHEEHVQEVLKLQPPREPRVDRWRGLCNAGMLFG